MKLPVIPSKNGLLAAGYRDTDGNIPSYAMWGNYSCVEVEIPDAVLGEDGHCLEKKFTKVNALVIYCEHNIVEHHEEIGWSGDGDGTYGSPFSNFWQALAVAECIAKELCTWVKLACHPDFTVTKWGKKFIDDGSIYKSRARHIIIDSLGDRENGRKFKCKYPLAFANYDADLRKYGPCIMNCEMDCSEFEQSFVSARKFYNVDIIAEQVMALSMIGCTATSVPSERYPETIDSRKILDCKFNSFSCSADHMTNVEINNASSDAFAVGTKDMCNCSVQGSDAWPKYFNDYSVSASYIRDCTVSKSSVNMTTNDLGVPCDVDGLVVNNGYVSGHGKISNVSVTLDAASDVWFNEFSPVYPPHAGGLTGTLTDISIAQNITVLKMWYDDEFDAMIFNQYKPFGIGDHSTMNNVTVVSNLTVNKATPPSGKEDIRINSFVASAVCFNNTVSQEGLTAKMTVNIDDGNKNYCFAVRDICGDCDGKTRYLAKGSGLDENGDPICLEYCGGSSSSSSPSSPSPSASSPSPSASSPSPSASSPSPSASSPSSSVSSPSSSVSSPSSSVSSPSSSGGGGGCKLEEAKFSVIAKHKTVGDIFSYTYTMQDEDAPDPLIEHWALSWHGYKGDQYFEPISADAYLNFCWSGAPEGVSLEVIRQGMQEAADEIYNANLNAPWKNGGLYLDGREWGPNDSQGEFVIKGKGSYTIPYWAFTGNEMHNPAQCFGEIKLESVTEGVTSVTVRIGGVVEYELAVGETLDWTALEPFYPFGPLPKPVVGSCVWEPEVAPEDRTEWPDIFNASDDTYPQGTVGERFDLKIEIVGYSCKKVKSVAPVVATNVNAYNNALPEDLR